MATNNSLTVKALQALDPARIGELNLLLAALSQRARRRDLAQRVISGMAARCDHLLQPESYITIGKELKLISEKDNVLRLTRLGRLMLANSTWPPHDRLNDAQIEVIAPEVLGHPAVIQHVVSVARLMRWAPGSSRFLYPRSIRVDSEQYLALKLLQATKLATVDDDYIAITEENYRKLDSLLGNVIPRSEEDLWRNLEETQQRARAAEEFVVRYEQQRLKGAHRDDLSSLVERVSATDVDAGYDVRSFEAKGDLRYVEVKSSTSSHVSFYWSSIERNFALAHRDSYWVYFVPRSGELPKLKHEMTLIKDPVGVEHRYLDMEASTYKVSLTVNIEDFATVANGATSARLIT